jgi:hypothetical protein
LSQYLCTHEIRTLRQVRTPKPQSSHLIAVLAPSPSANQVNNTRLVNLYLSYLLWIRRAKQKVVDNTSSIIKKWHVRTLLSCELTKLVSRDVPKILRFHTHIHTVGEKPSLRWTSEIQLPFGSVATSAIGRAPYPWMLTISHSLSEATSNYRAGR